MSAKRNAPPAASSNRNFIVMLGIILVLGLAILGYVVFKPAAPVATIVAPGAPLPGAKGHTRGSETAPVEVVMYGDFECPGCGKFATITEPDVDTRLVKTGLIRFSFMDFPLNGHPSTIFAHNAGACAGAQNKFWEMYDRIYNGQLEWSELANGRDMDAPKVMKRYAKELGLDTKAFKTCFDGRELQQQLRANYEEGIRLGVNGTPTFIIGKRLVWAVLSYDALKALVDSATTEAKKAAASATPR